jgi:uncharacterized spore protein YtfJ
MNERDTNQHGTSPDEPTVDAPGLHFTAAAEQLTSGLTSMTTVGADRVFGAPVHAGDHVIVTAAAFDISGGIGFGNGGDTIGNGGAGGGAGAHTEGRPVAAIDIGPHGVAIRPIIDFTRIGVTLLVGAFAVWRALRR